MAKRVKCALIPLLLVLLFVVVFESISTIFASGHAGVRPTSPHQEQFSPENESRELNKIVGVLEGLSGNEPLPEEVIRKLKNMKSKDLGTVSALCDRITEAGDSARADVAFMLIMATIFLS